MIDDTNSLVSNQALFLFSQFSAASLREDDVYFRCEMCSCPLRSIELGILEPLIAVIGSLTS